LNTSRVPGAAKYIFVSLFILDWVT
jgi:hypothetical protein